MAIITGLASMHAAPMDNLGIAIWILQMSLHPAVKLFPKWASVSLGGM